MIHLSGLRLPWFCLLALALIGLRPAGAAGQEQPATDPAKERITIDLVGVSLLDAVDRILRDSPLNCVWADGIDTSAPVTMEFDNVEVGKALKFLLDTRGLGCVLVDRVYLIKPKPKEKPPEPPAEPPPAAPMPQAPNPPEGFPPPTPPDEAAPKIPRPAVLGPVERVRRQREIPLAIAACESAWPDAREVGYDRIILYLMARLDLGRADRMAEELPARERADARYAVARGLAEVNPDAALQRLAALGLTCCDLERLARFFAPHSRAKARALLDRLICDPPGTAGESGGGKYERIVSTYELAEDLHDPRAASLREQARKMGAELIGRAWREDESFYMRGTLTERDIQMHESFSPVMFYFYPLMRYDPEAAWRLLDRKYDSRRQRSEQLFVAGHVALSDPKRAAKLMRMCRPGPGEPPRELEGWGSAAGAVARALAPLDPEAAVALIQGTAPEVRAPVLAAAARYLPPARALALAEEALRTAPDADPETVPWVALRVAEQLVSAEDRRIGVHQALLLVAGRQPSVRQMAAGAFVLSRGDPAGARALLAQAAAWIPKLPAYPAPDHRNAGHPETRSEARASVALGWLRLDPARALSEARRIPRLSTDRRLWALSAIGCYLALPPAERGACDWDTLEQMGTCGLVR